jgi:hypothetical protein
MGRLRCLGRDAVSLTIRGTLGTIPDSRHRNRDAGFHSDYVCLPPDSGRFWQGLGRSAFDPLLTFVMLGRYTHSRLRRTKEKRS